MTQSPTDNTAQDELQRMLLVHMLRDRDFEAEIRRIVDEVVASGGGTRGQVNAAVINNPRRIRVQPLGDAVGNDSRAQRLDSLGVTFSARCERPQRI